MNKYCGLVGFFINEETAPGVWDEHLVEHPYYGDIIQMRKDNGSSDQVNADVEVSNRISILSDPFACQHFLSIRYVTLFGQKMSVKSVEVEYPRLTLQIGGLYHE